MRPFCDCFAVFSVLNLCQGDFQGIRHRALRTAEETFPTRVYRDPMVGDTLTILITKPPTGRAGEDLRGLAYRCNQR